MFGFLDEEFLFAMNKFTIGSKKLIYQLFVLSDGGKNCGGKIRGK